MTYRTHLLLAGLLPLTGALGACSPATADASKDAAQEAVTPELLARAARGFDEGQALSRRRVFVIFDPQCPHCSRLWQHTRELAAQVRITWIPVGFINPASTAQGAAMLASEQPAQVLAEHETRFAAAGYRGGLAADAPTAQTRAPVEANTRLFERLGLSSVPVIVGVHESTGKTVVLTGAQSAQQIAQAMGWPVAQS